MSYRWDLQFIEYKIFLHVIYTCFTIIFWRQNTLYVQNLSVLKQIFSSISCSLFSIIAFIIVETNAPKSTELISSILVIIPIIPLENHLYILLRELLEIISLLVYCNKQVTVVLIKLSLNIHGTIYNTINMGLVYELLNFLLIKECRNNNLSRYCIVYKIFLVSGWILDMVQASGYFNKLT